MNKFGVKKPHKAEKCIDFIKRREESTMMAQDMLHRWCREYDPDLKDLSMLLGDNLADMKSQYVLDSSNFCLNMTRMAELARLEEDNQHQLEQRAEKQAAAEAKLNKTYRKAETKSATLEPRPKDEFKKQLAESQAESQASLRSTTEQGILPVMDRTRQEMMRLVMNTFHDHLMSRHRLVQQEVQNIERMLMGIREHYPVKKIESTHHFSISGKQQQSQRPQSMTMQQQPMTTTTSQ